MDLVSQLSLVVIASLGVRLALAIFDRPKRLTELATGLAIALPVALALQLSMFYTVVDLLVFCFALFLIAFFLIAAWFHIVQPMIAAAEAGGLQGLNFTSWNLRWDYLAVFVLAVPVFLLILTYHYFSGFFDFAIGRLLPMAVLGYLYYYIILKKW